MKKWMTIYLSVFVTTILNAQHKDGFGNKLEFYDPSVVWADFAAGMNSDADILQQVYSRGNDEGGRTEGDYETALMFLNLVTSKFDEQTILLHLDVYAIISTAEASHARGVRPYFLRAGFLANQGQYEGIRLVQNNKENDNPFVFLDEEFAKIIFSSNPGLIDSRGQWIYAKIDLGRVAISRDADYSGMVLVQSKNNYSYNSMMEYDPSVKHKIKWKVQIKNQEVSLKSLVMEQPKVRASNPSWLNQYLLHVGGYQFKNNEWLQIVENKERFLPKKY